MERPYLPLPLPEAVTRAKKASPAGRINGPSRERQQERIGAKLDQLERLIDAGRISELTSDPEALAPERAIVLEVAGRAVKDFAKQARKIGLEFVAEESSEIEPNPEFVVAKYQEGGDYVEQPEKAVPVQFYMSMPTESSLKEVASLWKTYKRNEKFPWGKTPWRDLFDKLTEVRTWGPKDRVSKADREALRERMSEHPEDLVTCEIEIWFSEVEQTRLDRESLVTQVVEKVFGKVLCSSVVSEIHYHALLVSLPCGYVDAISNLGKTVELLQVDAIMYIRPQSYAALDEIFEEGSDDEGPTPPPLQDIDPPLVAMMDAIPVQNHNLLSGRLEIDDPEDLEGRSVWEESRMHGTSIASLILHGDTNRPSMPITRRIHVRPVMFSSTAEPQEGFIPDTLIVDQFYRAVRRMFEGEGITEATAPTVRVINISLGDSSRPFARRVSPWARLLDYLAWKYKVLFLVAAGNSYSTIELPMYRNLTEATDADGGSREGAILRALHESRAARSILSPAESINALTIGALHEDGFDPNRGAMMRLNPYVSDGLPLIDSRIGLGWDGAVKPEILMPGGRAYLTMRSSGESLKLTRGRPVGPFAGIGAAVPDALGLRNRTGNFADTSTATALATRHSHQIMEAILQQDFLAESDYDLLSLYAKALLVHRAQIPKDLFRRMETLFDDKQSDAARKRDVSRFLGFGALCYDPNVECTTSCATLIGHGGLGKDEARTYRIPAPDVLSGYTGWRAITVTVAWFTPVQPGNQNYRAAKLRVTLPNALGADGNGTAQVDKDARGKATVFHTRIDGASFVNLDRSSTFKFTIDCMTPDDHFDEVIDYAVAISVEVGPEAGIDIYQAVRNRLAVQVG